MSNTLRERKRDLRRRILVLSSKYPEQVWVKLYKRLSRINRLTELDKFEKKVKLWEET